MEDVSCRGYWIARLLFVVVDGGFVGRAGWGKDWFGGLEGQEPMFDPKRPILWMIDLLLTKPMSKTGRNGLGLPKWIGWVEILDSLHKTYDDTCFFLVGEMEIEAVDVFVLNIMKY